MPTDERPRDRSTDKRSVRIYLDQDLYDELVRRADRAREKPSSPASRVLALWLTGQLVDIDRPRPLAATRSHSQPPLEISNDVQKVSKNGRKGPKKCPPLAAGSPHLSMYPLVHVPNGSNSHLNVTPSKLTHRDMARALAKVYPHGWSAGGTKRQPGIKQSTVAIGVALRGGATYEHILSGAEAYAAALGDQDRQYAPAMHRWLSREGWLEVPEQVKTKAEHRGNPGTSVEEIRAANAAAEDGSTWADAGLLARVKRIGRAE